MNFIIYGPTASGKSKYALQLAAEHDAVVINCDSQQVYAEIPVITAQPSVEDMRQCPHELYGYLPYGVSYNCALWLRDVMQKLDLYHKNGRNMVIVGGTGLYISALLNGMRPMPDLPADKVQQLQKSYEDCDVAELYNRLSALDPEYAVTLQPKDQQRISRALLFCEITGGKYSEYNVKDNANNQLVGSLNLQKIYLKPPRDQLYDIINQRFKRMLEQGAIQEVEGLMAKYPDHNFIKATGVKEIVAYLRGQMSFEDMVSKSQQLTRNYAKRQYTWFNNQLVADQVVDQLL